MNHPTSPQFTLHGTSHQAPERFTSRILLSSGDIASVEVLVHAFLAVGFFALTPADGPNV